MQKRHLLGVAFRALMPICALMPVCALAQPATKPVKIGVLTDFSSAYADYTGKGSVLAAQLAIDDFGGKVLDKPIELLTADFQLKPDIGLETAKRWFNVDGVNMIVDIPNSALAIGLQGIAAEQDKVIMTNAQSSEFTGKSCGTNGLQYDRDTYSVPTTIADALIKRGGTSWFFITVDYGLGVAYQKDATARVLEEGGTVVGSVKHPLNTADFASYLLSAQASKAKVVAFANAGSDTANAIAQAYEFGLQNTSMLAGFAIDVTDMAAIGLAKLQGVFVPNAGYWDLNDATRAFGIRFFDKLGRMPNANQMGVYVMTRDYLQAVQAVGSAASGRTVIAKMRELPLDDMVSKKAWIREDGRVMRDMFLAQVKTPSESKGPWDMLKIIDRVPAEVAYRPVAQSECPLLKK